MTKSKVIKEFCKRFGIKAKPDEYFCAYMGTNKIGYLIGQDYLDTFVEYVNDMYPDIEANAWVWATLHEIGHLKVKREFPNKISKYIENGINRMMLSTKMHHYDPSEVAATHWAAKYIKKHPKKIKKFEKKLKKELGEEIFNMYEEKEK